MPVILCLLLCIFTLIASGLVERTAQAMGAVECRAWVRTEAADYSNCVVYEGLDFKLRQQARHFKVFHDRKIHLPHGVVKHARGELHAVRGLKRYWSARKLHDVSLAGLPGPLIAKVYEIEHGCPGFHVISAFRPGARVRGSGRISLHALHKAADIAGPNYPCAYAHLRDYPGGASIDPYVVHHIHLSWDPGGREWHARFAHWQPHHHHYRIAEHRVALLVRHRFHRN
jgi:hypothetical protein